MLQIPKGKQIRIFKYEGTAPKDLTSDSTPLILSQDLNLQMQSSFEELVSESGSTVSNLIANLTQETIGFSISGTYKEFGLQVWKKTDPLSFSVQGILYMGATGGKGILDIAKSLMKTCLPEEGSGLQGLIPPGPSILSTIFKDTVNKRSNRFGIQIGKFYLDPCLIEGVEPSFSLETDDMGYPICITLTIKVKSVFLCTTNMVDNMFR